MELHASVRYRKGFPVAITQKFGANIEANLKYGLTNGHNGIDFISGLRKDAYGIGIVAAHGGKVARIVSDTPMSTKGNGAYIEYDENGKFYKTVNWHMSEVLVKAGQEVSTGQLIGRMGNSGSVRPEPTTTDPYSGTHDHFGLSIWDNGWVAIDPMPYFSAKTIALNFNEYEEKDLLGRLRTLIYPLLWAIQILREKIKNYKAK